MRPCYVGPVPETDPSTIGTALRKYVKLAPVAPWDFKSYNELFMTQKADLSSLIGLMPLIRLMLAIQPALRFLLVFSDSPFLPCPS